MTRTEHIAWAKKRALAYVVRGDCNGAFLSMISDLGKHEELQGSAYLGAMIAPWFSDNRTDAWTEWIDGFR